MVTSTNQPYGPSTKSTGVFHAPLPLFNKVANLASRNPESVLVRSATTMSGAEEEAQQSFRIKRNVLLHALNAKKNVSIYFPTSAIYYLIWSLRLRAYLIIVFFNNIIEASAREA